MKGRTCRLGDTILVDEMKGNLYAFSIIKSNDAFSWEVKLKFSFFPVGEARTSQP